MAEYTIRKMTVDDAGLVGEQREKMFQSVNKPQDALDAMREPFLKWVAPNWSMGVTSGGR